MGSGELVGDVETVLCELLMPSDGGESKQRIV